MDARNFDVKIERIQNGQKLEEVNMVFDEFNSYKISLTKKTSSDIEEFFNLVFDEVINKQKLLNFVLKDDDNIDLFHEVAEDIINQLNGEIVSSKANFDQIITINDKKKCI